MRAWLLAVCCAITWAGAAVAQTAPADWPRAFAAARAALAPHDDGYVLDDDPAAPDLLRKLWQMGEDAAAAHLAQHPAASDAEVKAALQSLDKDLDIGVVRLDGRSVLVSLQLADQGDVFIVAPGAVLWRAGQPSPAAGEFAPLQAWTEAAARGSCRQAPADADWANCGGLAPQVVGLPHGAGSERRFALIGAYAQAAGETESAQLSFWRWDGHSATPLLLRTYQFKIELDEGLQVSGDLALLMVKDDFKSFIACGACAGRQRRWLFVVNAAGVLDLGETSLTPELDLVDDLYDRAGHHRSLAGLASPAAAAAIAKVAAEGDAASKWPMGALDEWVLSRDHRRICVATDSGGAVVFALARTRRATVVSSARRVGDGLCHDVIHWPGATSGS
jgi:hypothetical protein